jgi:hypothetical protein
MEGWQDRECDLNHEPSGDCITERDAINSPIFQFTEERVHLGPIACVVSPILRNSVESAIANADLSAAGMIL